MSDRDLILGSLAEGVAPEGAIPEFEWAFASDDLVQAFSNTFEGLAGRIVTMEEIAEVLSRKSAICDDGLDAMAPILSEDPWTAEVGLFRAAGVCADTGSIFVCAGPNRRRLTSLTPPMNIVLVPKSVIYATLDQALARLSDRTSVMITGPSRTADIEGVLVRGVHGPGIIWACILEDQ